MIYIHFPSMCNSHRYHTRHFQRSTNPNFDACLPFENTLPAAGSRCELIFLRDLCFFGLLIDPISNRQSTGVARSIVFRGVLFARFRVRCTFIRGLGIAYLLSTDRSGVCLICSCQRIQLKWCATLQRPGLNFIQSATHWE